MLLRTAAGALMLLAAASAQPLPPDLRAALENNLHFTADELRNVEAGEPVARLLHSDRPDDLILAGVVRIECSSGDFIRAYKDIVRFESSKEVRRTGKFSNPPRESDLAGFHVPDLNAKELLACRPGSCSYKLPASAMERLRTTVDWSAPDAAAQAEDIIRKLWVDYLNRYRRDGDAALAVYYDTPSPFSVAQGMKELVGGLTFASAKVPDLIRYLREYPKSAPPDTEEFFYWQEAAFGLKPVVRTSHVVIQKLPRPDGPHYVIASKMLFATHYFRAAIELKYVYPVGNAMYFLTYQRSYVDGMTGFTGSILRRITPGRSQASLAKNLQLAKERLERSK